MLTSEQLAARRAGIGGSDAPAALGLSKWRTPLDLYLDKVGVPQGDFETTERMQWGNILEPVIANEWGFRTGKEVISVPMQQSREYPWMLANVDGLIPSERAGLEIKTVSGPACNEWGEEGSDEVPLSYLVQVYHYAIVTQFPRWYVAALFNGSELRTYVVDAKEELMRTIVDREREFWHHVETRVPPSPTTSAEASAMFPRSFARSIEVDADMLAALGRLKDIRALIGEAEKREDEAETAIKSYMGEADTLTLDGKVIATWKSAKDSAKVDADALRANFPDIAKQCTLIQPGSRRFLLK